MEDNILSDRMQKYISELVKRHVINVDGLADPMLMNYLCTQRIDEDYFDFKMTISSKTKNMKILARE